MYLLCHSNLNSIPVHKLQKLELLQDYISSKKVDVLCLSILNSYISCDGGNLQPPRFNLIRGDHLDNKNRWGVCIYYRNFLLLKLVNIHYLKECIIYVIKLGDNFWEFLCLYKSLTNTKMTLKTSAITCS